MISMATTGAVISTKALISNSWITRRDCPTVKYTIEAMKMENLLRAEQDGKVKKIVAKPGASLSVDEVIIEFE